MLPQMIRGLQARRRARAAPSCCLSRAQGPPDASAGGALGRRAAARRHRARGRQCAAHSARRRADRQSRRAHGGAGVRDARPIGARLRPRRHHRHPQSRHRRANGPPRDHPRRHGGRAGMNPRLVIASEAKQSNPALHTSWMLRRGACHRAGHFGSDSLAPRDDGIKKRPPGGGLAVVLPLAPLTSRERTSNDRDRTRGGGPAGTSGPRTRCKRLCG